MDELVVVVVWWDHPREIICDCDELESEEKKKAIFLWMTVFAFADITTNLKLAANLKTSADHFDVSEKWEP